MSCRITFFFVANCEAFEIIGSSGPALINGVLNAYAGPQPGKVYSLQLQQGEVIEIQSAGTTLNPTNAGPQVLIASIGQATSGDATHLTDTNRNWPLGWFEYNSSPGKKANLVILSGSGAGKFAPITDNTADTLTFDATVGMVPDNSSQYAIVWQLGNSVNTGSILPAVFVVPETGAYTVEITPHLGFGNDPFGRATYFLQKSELNKPAVPIAWARSSTYDSTRDCFWILDMTGWSAGTTVYLVQVDANGLQLSRTSLGPIGYTALVYCPVNDRLAIADGNGNLIIVDPTSKTIESTTAIAMNGNAGYMSVGAFCPSNNLVYFGWGQVVDPVAKTLVASIAGINDRIPFLMPVDNNIWYVETFNNGVLDFDVVDPGTNTIIHTVAHPGNFFGGQIAYVPSTGMVYSPSTGSPAGLGVFNPSTYAYVRNTLLDTPEYLIGIIYRPQDGFLYAGTNCHGTFGTELCSIVKIDPATESIVDRFLCPPSPLLFHLSASGNIATLGFGSASGPGNDISPVLPYNNQNCLAIHTP